VGFQNLLLSPCSLSFASSLLTEREGGSLCQFKMIVGTFEAPKSNIAAQTYPKASMFSSSSYGNVYLEKVTVSYKPLLNRVS
jgi:hypothetical protein